MRTFLHVATVCLLSYFSSLVLAVLIVASPGLTEALQVDSGRLFTVYLAVEALRQALLSTLSLRWLRSKGLLVDRRSEIIRALMYGCGTALLGLLSQVLFVGEPGWPVLTFAGALVVGSLIAVLLVRPTQPSTVV